VVVGGATEALVATTLDAADIARARKSLDYLDDRKGLDKQGP
jgi:hypothetical protein